MNVYIWIVTLGVFTFVETRTCKNDAKCRISRIQSMKAADCYNKDRTTFSQCLPQDLEIIDFSHNRIRKITRKDLGQYSSLKMLYLNDNLIAIIAEDAFEGLENLRTLDLSLNAISKLPPAVFYLPSLQTLYLGQNVNMNIVDTVLQAKRITSPLFHLDISYVMSEEPSQLPDLGVLTTLEKYNISGNKILDLSTKYFAGLCSLKILDTTNVSAEYSDSNCGCWLINRWLKDRKVSFKPFTCDHDESECPSKYPTIPTVDDRKLFVKCEEEINDNIKKSKVKIALLITLPLGLVIILIALICYLIRRRKNKHKQQKAIDQLKQEENLILNNVRNDKLR